MAGPDGVDTECVDMPLAPRPTAGPWTASDTGDAGVMEEALSQRPSWWRDGYGWEDVTVYVVEDILKSAPKHTTPLDEFLEETMMDAASTVCERYVSMRESGVHESTYPETPSTDCRRQGGGGSDQGRLVDLVALCV